MAQAEQKQTLKEKNPKAYKRQLAYMRKLTKAKRIWAKKHKAGLTTLSWPAYGAQVGALKRHKQLVKESEQIGNSAMLRRLLTELERAERAHLSVKERIREILVK